MSTLRRWWSLVKEDGVISIEDYDDALEDLDSDENEVIDDAEPWMLVFKAEPKSYLVGVIDYNDFVEPHVALLGSKSIGTLESYLVQVEDSDGVLYSDCVVIKQGLFYVRQCFEQVFEKCEILSFEVPSKCICYCLHCCIGDWWSGVTSVDGAEELLCFRFDKTYSTECYCEEQLEFWLQYSDKLPFRFCNSAFERLGLN